VFFAFVGTAFQDGRQHRSLAWSMLEAVLQFHYHSPRSPQRMMPANPVTVITPLKGAGCSAAIRSGRKTECRDNKSLAGRMHDVFRSCQQSILGPTE
jgi:hypothetical protein